MNFHFLEHDSLDFSRTNSARWAEKNGHITKTTYVCNDEALPDLDTVDWLFVMGGSPHADDEESNPWLPAERALVAEAVERRIPVLGICFGAQLLARVLGGEVFPGRYREIGWHTVELTNEGKNSLPFQGIPDQFITFHWHFDQFSLPPNCTRLARSKATPNQAFVCRDRPAVGLQFHPEYTLDMVRFFAREHSQEWIPNTFVSGKDKVLEETENVSVTYWLMEALLNNLSRLFFAS